MFWACLGCFGLAGACLAQIGSFFGLLGLVWAGSGLCLGPVLVVATWVAFWMSLACLTWFCLALAFAWAQFWL